MDPQIAKPAREGDFWVALFFELGATAVAQEEEPLSEITPFFKLCATAVAQEEQPFSGI